MGKIKFDIESLRQHTHYTHAEFSILKIRASEDLSEDFKEDGDIVLNSIIASKYYLWNYEFYPEGYPFFEKKIEMHGPFKRDSLSSLDYSLLSFQKFLYDILSFVINRVCLQKNSMKKEDECFVGQVIKEIFFLGNDIKYYRLNLELYPQKDIGSANFDNKIAEYYPFSIFKSYIVFNSRKNDFYIIQIGDA